MDFGLHLGIQISSKIAAKTGMESKRHHIFVAFVFFRFSGVPPNEIYSIRGPFWDDFLNIFVQVLNVIVHVFFVCF